MNRRCSPGTNEGLHNRLKSKITMPVRIDVWTDFTCPFCFLVTLKLERLQQEATVDIHWRSLLVPSPNAASMSSTERALEETRRQRIGEPIQIECGLELNPGPIGINTYPAHLAVKYARAYGKAAELHRALMRAYWLEGHSIADLDVVSRLLAQLNLGAVDLARKLKQRPYATAIAEDSRRAASLRVHRVPALLFANKFRPLDSQSYKVWREILFRNRTAGPGGPSRPRSSRKIGCWNAEGSRRARRIQEVVAAT
jgi:predicted DsbA family dithiol-disulfide isomerase